MAAHPQWQTRQRHGGADLAPDHRILLRQRTELQHEANFAQKSYYERTALAAKFAQDAQSVMQRRAIPRRVAAWRQADELALEARREKLRAVFDNDTARWRADLLAMESTPKTRIEEMRRRVGELKAKREEERQRIVREKLEEHRRLNCDELRAVHSRAMTQQITAARSDQIKDRKARELALQQENAAMDAAWEQQRLTLVDKEERDMLRRRAADVAQARCFDEQLDRLRQFRQQEKDAEMAYARAIKEHCEIQRIREEHADALRKEQSLQIRRELEISNKEAAARRAREQAESLAADLKWIQSLLDMDAADKADMTDRRHILRQTLLDFRDKVVAQRTAEHARVAELDRIFAADAERTWKVKAAKWAAEQKARAKLLQDVMASREEQLRQRAEEARQRSLEKRGEREAVERAVREANDVEMALRAQNRRNKTDYHDALRQQMDEKQSRTHQANEREHEEESRAAARAKEYEEWMSRELARTSIGPSI
ncbi:tumor suppressor, Mitostatin-domain-containing protein [Blastocladiella britannica]|nr:tumor suppressor, Mitostatin-domain-containing protein [Blastocladiella britannica]